MTHLKKFWWVYLLIVGAIITVAMNWTTIKGWFTKTNGGSRRQCIKVNQITGGCAEWND